jgi:hypothetical protein
MPFFHCSGLFLAFTALFGLHASPLRRHLFLCSFSFRLELFLLRLMALAGGSGFIHLSAFLCFCASLLRGNFLFSF